MGYWSRLVSDSRLLLGLEFVGMGFQLQNLEYRQCWQNAELDTASISAQEIQLGDVGEYA